MIIFFRFLLIVSCLLASGCASSSVPGTPGFQKAYPWTFIPYTNAPWIYKVSFDDIIDISAILCSKKIANSKLQQDLNLQYPINGLSDNLNLYE